MLIQYLYFVTALVLNFRFFLKRGPDELFMQMVIEKEIFLAKEDS